MLDKQKFMALHYYDYGDPFAGSYHGMRYRLEKTKKEEENVLRATVWPEPYNFLNTPREKKISQDFPFSVEGKDQAVDWFEQIREEKRELFDQTPGILDLEPQKDPEH